MTNGAAVSFMKINKSIRSFTLITSYCELQFACSQPRWWKHCRSSGLQFLLHILALTELYLILNVRKEPGRYKLWWRVYFSDHCNTKSHGFGCMCALGLCSCLKWERVGRLSRPVNWQTVSCPWALKRLRADSTGRRMSHASIHPHLPQTNLL